MTAPAPPCRRAKPLWDSYFFASGPFSKPYAARAHISHSHSTIRPLPLPAAARLCIRRTLMDLAVLAIAAVFFALALGYVAVCDKL